MLKVKTKQIRIAETVYGDISDYAYYMNMPMSEMITLAWQRYVDKNNLWGEIERAHEYCKPRKPSRTVSTETGQLDTELVDSAPEMLEET